jgi:hypothetical protein
MVAEALRWFPVSGRHEARISQGRPLRISGRNGGQPDLRDLLALRVEENRADQAVPIPSGASLRGCLIHQPPPLAYSMDIVIRPAIRRSLRAFRTSRGWRTLR